MDKMCIFISWCLKIQLKNPLRKYIYIHCCDIFSCLFPIFLSKYQLSILSLRLACSKWILLAVGNRLQPHSSVMVVCGLMLGWLKINNSRAKSKKSLCQNKYACVPCKTRKIALEMCWETILLRRFSHSFIANGGILIKSCVYKSVLIHARTHTHARLNDRIWWTLFFPLFSDCLSYLKAVDYSIVHFLWVKYAITKISQAFPILCLFLSSAAFCWCCSSRAFELCGEF